MRSATLPPPARRSSAPPKPAAHYQPAFVRHLFDQLAPSYNWQRVVSLGLTGWWRRQAVALLPRTPAPHLIDLMTGCGEMWPALQAHFRTIGHLHAVDFSPAMLAGARAHLPAVAGQLPVTLHEAEATQAALPAARADAVVCGFGLKTLAPTAYEPLARELHRLLRPGGSFVLLELTIPARGWRRAAVATYLRLALPCVAWLTRGRAAPHHYLPYYAQAFGNLDAVEGACWAAGLVNVRQVPLLLGCATALVGQKAPVHK